MKRLLTIALLGTALVGFQAPAQAEVDTHWTIILSGGDAYPRHHDPRPTHRPPVRGYEPHAHYHPRAKAKHHPVWHKHRRDHDHRYCDHGRNHHDWRRHPDKLRYGRDDDDRRGAHHVRRVTHWNY